MNLSIALRRLALILVLVVCAVPVQSKDLRININADP